MLCSNKIYGVPYINGYAFPIDNLFSSYNGNQGGKETQVKKEKGEKIKINTKQGKWAIFKLTFIPGRQPFNGIENIVSKEYCEIDGQKNAFLLSKKEAERVAEVLQKAIKEKKSDIEINIEEAKDNDEEIREIYILIVDITSRVKKKCQGKMEEIEKKGVYNEGEEGKNKDKKTTMAGLFEPLEYDKFKIYILAADTRGVKNMSYMFSYCRFVSQIEGLENWDTKNITNMSDEWYV